MAIIAGIFFAVIFAVVGVVLFDPDLVYDTLKPLPPKEKVFPFKGKSYAVEGRDQAEDTTIHDFKINVATDVLEDLKDRLNRTRYVPDNIVGTAFTYGFAPDALKEIVEYWLTKYDWASNQKSINQHAQHWTTIEGLRIHYLHAKPKNIDKGTTVHTVVMLHGWPGLFYEFWHMIPHLLKPQKLANGESVALELIIPSMPGFAFSDAPQVPGMEMADTSRIMAKLMQRIKVDKYFIHGIDWGAVVGRSMAVMYPDRVLGISVTLYPIPVNFPFFVKSLTAKIFPFTVEKSERYKLIVKHLGYQIEDVGFAHVHATKPHTLGASLSDSPAGLAAWILDKQATQTRPYENEYKEDGGLEQYLDRDTLLTNIMLYWATNCIGTAIRVYKENCGYFGCDDNASITQYRFVVPVPAVFSDFRDEAPGLQPPDSWAKKYWKNIVAIKKHRGGHFSALERPEALSKDVWLLVQSVASTL